MHVRTEPIDTYDRKLSEGLGKLNTNTVELLAVNRDELRHSVKRKRYARAIHKILTAVEIVCLVTKYTVRI